MSTKRRFSGKMGEEYDLFTRAYPKYGELHEVLAGAISGFEPEKNGKMRLVRSLEIGCGTGISTSYILDSRADIVLDAVDHEPKMVRQISKNLIRPIREDRLRVHEADILEYMRTAAAGSLDLVASGFTLHNFDSWYRSRVMKEIHRCLSKGGLFVNADKYAMDDDEERFRELGAQLGRFFDAFVPLGKYELLREWVLHNVADQAPERVMKESEALAQMNSIGFREVKILYRHGFEAVVKGRKS